MGIRDKAESYEISNFPFSSFYYLIQHPVQLIPSFNYTVTVIAINNEDKSLCILEVVSP